MKTIIVAGIARSGLTATMQMLNAGGYPCVGEYPAFEAYQIGQVPVGILKGKAFKCVDTHLHFPNPGDYHVIRLRRNLKQQAKSSLKFLRMLGQPVDRRAVKQFEKSFPQDYRKIDSWAKRQKGVLEIDFENIILDPVEVAKRIAEFTGESLDIDKMASVIIKRGPECYDGMLELEMI